MANTFPKLHNAMWPGLVGKGDDDGQEPPISLDRMLELTAEAEVNGTKFDGVDLFLDLPHINADADDSELRKIGDKVADHELVVGSVVGSVWPAPAGRGGSSMDTGEGRAKFLAEVKNACRIAQVFNRHGIRKYGIVRIDSAEFGVEAFKADSVSNTRKIVNTFREAATIAADHGERLAAEGEVCWAGLHNIKYLLRILSGVNKPNVLGFQADMAHILTMLLGYNDLSNARLKLGFTDEEMVAAWLKACEELLPFTIDFHISQSDGDVHGAGSHDKTGKHIPAKDPRGKLKITREAGPWLKGASDRGIQHICWDGCMFPNADLEDAETWTDILGAMIDVRNVHGWN